MLYAALHTCDTALSKFPPRAAVAKFMHAQAGRSGPSSGPPSHHPLRRATAAPGSPSATARAAARPTTSAAGVGLSRA